VSGAGIAHHISPEEQRLDERLGAADTNVEWQRRQLLAAEVPSATADPFMQELGERLNNLARAGFDALPKPSIRIRSPALRTPAHRTVGACG